MFLLKAKDLSHEDNVDQLLLKHLLPEDFPEEHIMECLKEHQHKILFIIDGFDEVIRII